MTGNLRRSIDGRPVDCAICRHENRPGSKFCSNCGNALQVICPVCSHAAEPDANFCSNCGSRLGADAPGDGDVTRYIPPEMLTRISAARAANSMRGERRTVTMLFADIKGSTAAAEGLDPEDWTDIINGAFEHLIKPVYRYEGTLARLLGDAVLAFFGAPIAHEDDPIRAVRAGLEIVDAMGPYKDEIDRRWGIPIDVRVGINTGLVVVGEVASDLRVEYTALGDAVNVAARMEQTAEPGTVRVTAETWSLVGNNFEGEEIGPVEVKGKSEPVMAFRVVGLRQDAGSTSRTRPLVGRTEELARLETLRDRLMNGSGWITSIMGEAGLGKSHLLETFRNTTAQKAAVRVDAPGDLTWLSAASLSYDAQVPYSAIRQLLYRWWGLDTAEERFEVVSAVAAEVLPDVDDAASYLGFLAGVSLPQPVTEFLGVLDPPVLDQRVRHSLAAYLQAEAARRPVIMAVEDIHWADPMSLVLLEEAMTLTETQPFGMIMTMRPYRDEPPWHLHEVAERDHPHRYEHVELGLLDREAAEALLEALVEGSDVSDETRRTILERSEGNPLFIEQMAHAIRDDGGTEISVPTGLNAVLTARLDRLDQESRRVAQIASVVGIEFDREAVAALLDHPPDLDSHLTDLLRRQILVEQGNSRSLSFSHALMRDAAYSTLLLRIRRDLHRRLAEYLAENRPDRVEEIALHYEEAGDLGAAFPYLVEAGERASRAMALSDAIDMFVSALENIPADADPGLTIRAYDGLGMAYSFVPDLTQSETAFQRLVDYADRCGRPSAKVTALNRLGVTTATLSGDLVKARHYLEEARELARATGDEKGLAEYHMNACSVAFLSGDLASAVSHDGEIARWGRRVGADAIRAEGLSRMAGNLMWLMDFDRLEDVIEEATTAARDAHDTMNLALLDAQVNSRLRLRAGDTAGALELLVNSEPTVVKFASFFVPALRTVAASLLWGRGDPEAALARLELARDDARGAGMTFFVAIASAALARIHAVLGMTEEMTQGRDDALDNVRAPLGDFVASTVWAELGEAALAAGDYEEAGSYFDQGLESASASKYWEKPRLLIGRARVNVSRGDTDAAHAALDEAQAFVMGKQLVTFDASLEQARAEALLAEGKREEAAERLSRALQAATDAEWRMLEVEIAGLAARVASELGDAGAARAYLERARPVVDDVVAGVTDGELAEKVRAHFSRALGLTATG